MTAQHQRRPSYVLEFYQDENGDAPVRRWLTEELSPRVRRLLGAAMSEILQHEGAAVCNGSFGKQLGGGIFEFRVNGDPQARINEGRKHRGKEPKRVEPPAEAIMLRVFCHAHGKRIILLLGGYDKANDPAAKRQNTEIAEARRRLTAWKIAARSAVPAKKRRKRASN